METSAFLFLLVLLLLVMFMMFLYLNLTIKYSMLSDKYNALYKLANKLKVYDKENIQENTAAWKVHYQRLMDMIDD